jgi:hypothetical protein
MYIQLSGMAWCARVIKMVLVPVVDLTVVTQETIFVSISHLLFL